MHHYWFFYENWWEIFPASLLEECKYKIKKIQTLRFINTELKSDSDSDDNSDDDSDNDSDDSDGSDDDSDDDSDGDDSNK